MNTILLMLVAHGGGSTAQTTWGHLLPELARKHHVIAPEMQGHGHTADIDRPFSFEQMADDTAALLEQLGVREGFAHATPENMPAPLREAYLAAAPHPDLARFVAKSVKMMQTFKDVPGVVLVEHEAKLARLVQHGQLAVFPGSGHGTYLGAAEAAKPGSRVPELALAMLEVFLAEP